MSDQATRIIPTFNGQKILELLRLAVLLSNRGTRSVGLRELWLALPGARGESTIEHNLNVLVDSNLVATLQDHTFRPLQVALEYTREFIWSPNEAGAILKPAIAASWYGEGSIQLLRRRPVATVRQLAEWIQLENGIHSREFEGILSLIEVMLMSGLIEKEGDDKLQLGTGLEYLIPEEPANLSRSLLLEVASLDDYGQARVAELISELKQSVRK